MGRRSPRRPRREQRPRPAARRPLDPNNEPLPEGEDWVEWGGELVWAAGFTEGGAPYGLSVADFRKMSEETAGTSGWARAKRLLAETLARRAAPGARIDIGWISSLGEGLCRKAFAAEADIHPDREGLSGDYVVLLPLRAADPEFDARVRFEAWLLDRLARIELPFRVPRLLGVLPDAGRPALIETFVTGIPLDLRSGRQPAVCPWEVVAEVAAAVHGFDVEGLATNGYGSLALPGARTRREYALAQLSVFADLDEPLLREVHAWALEHLPPEDPAVLLHGDLLGQNILLHPREPLGLIDWENAKRGDPAYDLAIVTRAARQPFQIAGGLDRLLAAYASRAREIEKDHVHLYELCLLARWYRESLAGPHRGGHLPAELLKRLHGHFRRILLPAP
jgi:aminoglycoside phosphotransferase (APT) family kinase protein